MKDTGMDIEVKIDRVGLNKIIDKYKCIFKPKYENMICPDWLNAMFEREVKNTLTVIFRNSGGAEL
jgi:hypothetical protein